MKRFLLTLCAVCAATFAWAQEIYYVDVDTWTPSNDWEDGCFTCEKQGDGSLKIVSFTRNCGPFNPVESDFTKCPGADFDLSRVFGSTKLIVGNGVFANLQMNSLIFSENTIEIGSGACSGCVNLSSIEIPESVTSIGADAFSGCSGLSEITFYGAPPSATSTSFPSATGRYTSDFAAWGNVIVDGKWNNLSMECDWSLVFNYSVANNRVTINGLDDSSYSGALSIPSKIDGYPVTSIGYQAFYNCSGLTSVTIPSSVTSIGSYAFSGCSGLTSITIPSSVTSIGEYAFSGCSGLTSITIPSSVTSIGECAFYYCSSLTSITIPEGVTSIGSSTFFGCSSLTSITIPEGVTSIGDRAFNGCSGLTSITIPEGVTSIGYSAFSGCSGLTSVTIPEGVTLIDEATFSGCSSLSSVVIPEGVTAIGDRAFNGCSGLTSVTIPEGVTSIGSYAFSSMTKVSFNGNLVAAKWPAGLDKTLAVSVTIPSNVSSIANNAFENCTGVTSVTISESVTSIGYNAFYYCSGLTSVTIPEGVTSIGDRAFYYCSGLTFVTIPEGVTSIGDSAFNGCSGLTSVTIPEGVTSIGSFAFYNCSGLKEVHISDIAAWCAIDFDDSHSNPLYYAKNLYLNGELITDLVIPEGVTSIEGYAFYNCSGLTSVTIPSSVTSIGNSAFEGCSGNLEVFFADAVPEGYANSSLSGKKISYPKEYASQWEALVSESKRLPLADVIATANVTVSAEMTTPRMMKVTYSVASDLPTVKIRAVAFADGVRSFAKIVPVKNGENVPLGGEVASNTEHTFIWNVFEDWDTDLSKVAIEILVQEGELLPQELITIPTVGDNKAMTITRNTITTKMAFNALLWCIAEGDEALTISNGVVRANDTQIANGTSVSQNANLLNYLYGKMGYKVLAGDDLSYAKAATRIELQSSGISQHAIKIEE